MDPADDHHTRAPKYHSDRTLSNDKFQTTSATRLHSLNQPTACSPEVAPDTGARASVLTGISSTAVLLRVIAIRDNIGIGSLTGDACDDRWQAEALGGHLPSGRHQAPWPGTRRTHGRTLAAIVSVPGAGVGVQVFDAAGIRGQGIATVSSPDQPLPVPVPIPLPRTALLVRPGTSWVRVRVGVGVRDE